MDNYLEETLSALEEAIGNLEFDADSFITTFRSCNTLA